MPTYEYECSQGCTFEIEQSITDDPLKTCPKAHCPKGKGRVKVQRLISGGNFILKGGGWYADGYSSSGGSKSSPAASSGSDSGSSASSSSSSSTSSSGSSSGSGE